MLVNLNLKDHSTRICFTRIIFFDKVPDYDHDHIIIIIVIISIMYYDYFIT
jgi:hypothetical protein